MGGADQFDLLITNAREAAALEPAFATTRAGQENALTPPGREERFSQGIRPVKENPGEK